MKLGTHMPGGERRKPIDNEVKIEQKFGNEKSIKFLLYF
jgi:hypothetical protein